MTETERGVATFRCGDRAATATYRGKRAWDVAGPAGLWSGPHEEVARAIRDALGLAGEIPYDTAAVTVDAHGARGTIKNNTFPTDVWFVNIDGDGSWASVEPGLEAAILAALVGLRLVPVGARSVAPAALDRARFSRAALAGAPDRDAWARDLEAALAARLRDAVDAPALVPRLARELKALGHDLWSFDDSDDFAIWCARAAAPDGPGLMIRFGYPAYEVPFVEVTVRTNVS